MGNMCLNERLEVMFDTDGNIRNSVKAIIINNNKILLTMNRISGEIFYLLPGGGQKKYESIKDCLVRECKEEVNAKIEMTKLLFIRDYIGKNHEFYKSDTNIHQVELMFKCKLLNDDLKMNKEKDDYQIGFEWVSLEKLENIKLYPKILKEKLIKVLNNNEVDVYLGDVN